MFTGCSSRIERKGEIMKSGKKKADSKDKMKKITAPKAGSNETQAAASDAIPGNAGPGWNKLIIFLAGAFLVFNIVELYYFLAKPVQKEKFPVLISSWAHNYRGCTSIAQYGDYLYGIDNTRGDIYINKKDNGDPIKVLNFTEGVVTVAEDAARNIYILVRTGEVLKLDPKSFKVVSRVRPEGAGVISWMDIDSKDNFYFSKPDSSVILKYNRDFQKIVSFGGRSGDKEGFTNIGRIFTGPNDDVYCMDHLKDGKMGIKIFSADGKFKKGWIIKGIKAFDGFTNMAIAPNGDIYINVLPESTVYVYGNGGKLLGKFSGNKDKTFNIQYIASITGGKNGVIYVHTHRIGVFNVINYGK
jgi:hypothetical protein